MGSMKGLFFVLSFFALISCARDRHPNIPDIEDKNRVPDALESREEEEERQYFGDPPVF